MSVSKIMRDMLCFIVEMAVGGCEDRRYKMAVAVMVAYARMGPSLRSVIAGG